MSAENEGVDDGGQNGSSEVPLSGATAALRLAGLLTRSATDLSGNLVPSATVQLSLRDTAKRHVLLEDVVVELTPRGVDHGIWRAWLEGGRSPFEMPLKKPSNDTNKDDGPSRILSRNSTKMTSQMAKIAKVRRQLEAEERELAHLEAVEDAALQYLVVDGLANIVTPAFAMGPAWTLLRAISSHISEVKLEEETGLLFGADREKAIAHLKAEREEQRDLVLEYLDLGSGSEMFEEELREALIKVAQSWVKRRDTLLADGRQPRSKKLSASRVHPLAEAEAGEVLAGLDKAS